MQYICETLKVRPTCVKTTETGEPVQEEEVKTTAEADGGETDTVKESRDSSKGPEASEQKAPQSGDPSEAPAGEPSGPYSVR